MQIWPRDFWWNPHLFCSLSTSTFGTAWRAPAHATLRKAATSCFQRSMPPSWISNAWHRIHMSNTVSNAKGRGERADPHVAYPRVSIFHFAFVDVSLFPPSFGYPCIFPQQQQLNDIWELLFLRDELRNSVIRHIRGLERVRVESHTNISKTSQLVAIDHIECTFAQHSNKQWDMLSSWLIIGC